MAAQTCHGPGTAAAPDCHGTVDETGSPGIEPADCPVHDATPDLGKLPTFMPLPGQPRFLTTQAARSAEWASATGLPSARAGPHVATDCQLLI